MLQFISHSFAETFELGVSFGRKSVPNTILLLNGDLGAGKTAFIKGFVAGVFGNEEIEVTSPTYTYLNIYKGLTQDKQLLSVYHFDLYRLKDVDEFLSMGFDELFDAGGFCCVEWAEKIKPLHLPHATHVQITHVENGVRKIEFRESK